jgi:hypothetical protein
MSVGALGLPSVRGHEKVPAQRAADKTSSHQEYPIVITDDGQPFRFGTVSGTAQSADEGRSAITATGWRVQRRRTHAHRGIERMFVEADP